MKGGGSWTSLCPICGIHFRVNFTKKIDFDELLESIDKSPKLLEMSKKEWKENKEKYIENFHEFKKIEKHTFKENIVRAGMLGFFIYTVFDFTKSFCS